MIQPWTDLSTGAIGAYGLYPFSCHGPMDADDERSWVAVTFMHEGTSSLSNVSRNQPSLRGWSIKYCWALEFLFSVRSRNSQLRR